MAVQSQILSEEQQKLREAQKRYEEEQARDLVARPLPRATVVASESKPSALGFWKVALAVFVGNLMTGTLVAIIYAITH